MVWRRLFCWAGSCKESPPKIRTQWRSALGIRSCKEYAPERFRGGMLAAPVWRVRYSRVNTPYVTAPTAATASPPATSLPTGKCPR